MAGRLAGKVCVITGTASGIGAETARLFRSEDALVVGVDLNASADVDLSLEADVTDEGQVAGVYERTQDRYGRIDVLFNNAGISPSDDVSVLDTSLEAWQRVQDVNLKSVFLCCKHGIPRLLDSGGGSVVNTASFVAVMGAATSQISYTASKGGVLALSRELGVQFARSGVRARSTRRCCRSSTPTTPRPPRAGWSTCPWAVSHARGRSPTPCSSWPPTTRRSSPRRRSWSTAASRARTSRRCSGAAVACRRRLRRRRRTGAYRSTRA